MMNEWQGTRRDFGKAAAAGAAALAAGARLSFGQEEPGGLSREFFIHRNELTLRSPVVPAKTLRRSLRTNRTVGALTASCRVLVSRISKSFTAATNCPAKLSSATPSVTRSPLLIHSKQTSIKLRRR